MPSDSEAVWAIDLGNNSLKALRLVVVEGVVQVIGFDNIQHSKILSATGVKDAERDELVALSLRQFVQQNDLGRDEMIISVPSQNSFARFVTLPPVDTKRLPEIIRFEAVQQIPFDINDVQWDWQMMTKADDPEKRVGIFAIKNEVVNSVLEHFDRENLPISFVQMVPMALYNYLVHDRPELVNSDDKATVIINIGAESTDLVICTKSGVWQRCILIGSNAFTRAIVDTFRLSFEKAEKLKRTAPVSKYARQIFQAMRPVFTDLASEVQRSLGFYASSNSNVKFSRIIALGGGTKLRGLLKYLQQTLQIPVERPDSFKKLAIAPDLSTAKFHENISDFAVVYGLALQALDMARIKSNLLPRSVARSMAWASKTKYFTIAACLLLLVSLMSIARTMYDKFGHDRAGSIRQGTQEIINSADSLSSQLSQLQSEAGGYEATIEKTSKPFKYRNVVPELYETIITALPNTNTPEQRVLYEAFKRGDVEAIVSIPRKQRKLLFVTDISAYFSYDLANAGFGLSAMLRRGTGIDAGTEDVFDDSRLLENYIPRGESDRTLNIDMAGVEEKQAGFVVSIVGYSPYMYIGELLHPSRAEDQPGKWGFVNRLYHLNEIVDGNSPFELYQPEDVNHMKLRSNLLDMTTTEGRPGSIGVPEFRPSMAGSSSGRSGDTSGVVLIDPLTREIMSRVPKFNEYGERIQDSLRMPAFEDNDSWFIMDVKLVWKDAPAEPVDSTSPMAANQLPIIPTPPAPAGSTDLSAIEEGF